jgi:hypothetical protein
MHFNTDNPADVARLLELHPPDRRFEFKKLSKYGSGKADRRGLVPVEDAIPDQIIPFEGVKEAIQHADEMQSWPAQYMQRTWCPKGKRYNQNGLGFCWTWSGVGCCMTTRALEAKPTVLLSPVSMGYLVNWRNEGNYLEDFIQGARNEGICLAPNGDFNDTTRSQSKYPLDSPERKLYRLKGVLDTNPSAGDKAMLCQSLTLLLNKCSGYESWNWWGHATEHVRWLWTPGTYLNVTAVIHNSHNEQDFITLEGTKCIPDEFYGFISTEPTE